MLSYPDQNRVIPGQEELERRQVEIKEQVDELIKSNHYHIPFDEVEILDFTTHKAGGFGDVFRGRWKNQKVILKRVNRVPIESLTRHFSSEVMCLHKARSCPNVPHLYGATWVPDSDPNRKALMKDSEYPLLVLRDWGSKTLGEFLGSNRGSITWKHKRVMALELIYALESLHSFDIIHGDISLGNIVVSDTNSLALLDFGLSKFTQLEDRTSGNITGTPRFVSPEKYADRKNPYTRKSDIYSLGAILWSIYAEEPFLGNASEVEISERIRTGNVEKIPRVADELVPLEYVKIVKGFLETDPDLRMDLVEAKAILERSNFENVGLSMRGGIRYDIFPRDELLKMGLKFLYEQSHRDDAEGIFRYLSERSDDVVARFNLGFIQQMIRGSWSEASRWYKFAEDAGYFFATYFSAYYYLTEEYNPALSESYHQKLSQQIYGHTVKECHELEWYQTMARGISNHTDKMKHAIMCYEIGTNQKEGLEVIPGYPLSSCLYGSDLYLKVAGTDDQEQIGKAIEYLRSVSELSSPYFREILLVALWENNLHDEIPKWLDTRIRTPAMIVVENLMGLRDFLDDPIQSPDMYDSFKKELDESSSRISKPYIQSFAYLQIGMMEKDLCNKLLKKKYLNKVISLGVVDHHVSCALAALV